MSRIEFYIGSASTYIADCRDGAVPRKGEYINIRRVTYKIIRVDWAIDFADKPEKELRANVVLKEVKQ